MLRAFSEGDNGELSEFVANNNYNLYLMCGYFPNSFFEISTGIKYQPFLKELLEGLSKTEFRAEGTLPVSYLLDIRYMFSEHFGLMGGAELYNLRFNNEIIKEANLTGGYLYIGFTYR